MSKYAQKRTKRTKRGGCKKGGGKKSPFTKKYTKISKIDCAKKNHKSREKTLKCLDDKKEQFKSLGNDSPKDMKELQKEKKDYQKSMKKLMEKITKDCIKYHGDEKKLKKCAEKEMQALQSYGKDIPKIVMDEMRDNIQRMIDHTQKVDLGMFSDSKKGGGKKTFKSEKKRENVYYWKCIKKKKNTRACNKKRSKTLKRLEKKYPKEWSQYQKDFMTNPKLRY